MERPITSHVASVPPRPGFVAFEPRAALAVCFCAQHVQGVWYARGACSAATARVTARWLWRCAVANALSGTGFALVLLGVTLSVAFPVGGVAVAAVALMAAGLLLFVVAWWEPATVALALRIVRRWVSA